MRWRLWGLLAAVIVLSPVTPARATVPVVIIDGNGWGHGVGMAQDGAFWMAKAGATTPQILGHFYPGTSLAKVTASDIRVAVFTGMAITVGFPSGGRLDERGSASSGFPVRVDPGGFVRLSLNSSQLVVEPIAGAHAHRPPTTTTSPPTTTPMPATTVPMTERSESLWTPSTTTSTTAPQAVAPAPASHRVTTANTVVLTSNDGGTLNLVERQRRFRGFVDVVPGAAGFRMINQVDVEQYLRGMGEVRDPSWPSAALRTQAIAARTYAIRAMAVNGEICDGQRCQVYLGQQAEYGAMDKAVRDTAGQVLMFNRSLATAVYSANAGGHSATREEGFGTTGGEYPYLRAAPYETKNPMPWNVKFNIADVGARLGRPRATAVRVAEQGPSGRALSISIDSPEGTTTVTGRAFAAALGLRSTMFSLRLGTSDAPDALPAGSILQVAPDELGSGEAAPAQNAIALSPTGFELPDRPQPFAATAVANRGRPAAEGAAGLILLLLAVAATFQSWRGASSGGRLWTGSRANRRSQPG